ncbi:DUF3106 domain-containing protein [Aquimonas sp.]|jgi:hypothetical protein|uniref:DUF3106 domain-containing protein n=1 Tax=Aquimonas sp. TaxID=1872588 RepID=UPI0037BF7E3C
MQAWLRLEGLASVPVPGAGTELARWAELCRRLQDRRLHQPELRPPAPGPLAPAALRLWAVLPGPTRDLLVLRVVAGQELASIALLQRRPPALVEREWLLMARRLSVQDAGWTRGYRRAFEAPETVHAASDDPTIDTDSTAASPALRIALSVAAVLCLLGAAFAPQLQHWLLDPAQQRLQAPPAVPAPVLETVPLSAPDFALWGDTVEFDLLADLDFLLWRLLESGHVMAADSAPAEPSAPRQLPAERTTLDPWRSHWPELDDPHRAVLWSHAALWDGLDEAGRARLLARAEAFQALSPQARAELRDQHAAWMRRGPGTRAAVLATARGFAAAEPTQQAVLRETFQALPEAVRRGLLAGKSPALAELAREVFAFVPEEERTATVAMLSALAASDHALLLAMSRRLDPPAREALRRELLAAAPIARAGLLTARAAEVGLRRRSGPTSPPG